MFKRPPPSEDAIPFVLLNLNWTERSLRPTLIDFFAAICLCLVWYYTLIRIRTYDTFMWMWDGIVVLVTETTIDSRTCVRWHVRQRCHCKYWTGQESACVCVQFQCSHVCTIPTLFCIFDAPTKMWMSNTQQRRTYCTIYNACLRSHRHCFHSFFIYRYDRW